MQALPPVAPGVYPGPGVASLLRANEQQFLFQQQLITAGQASIAVQLERIKSASYPFAISFQVWFTNVSGAAASPGAFTLDFETSDIDLDAQYCKVQSLVGIASLNSSFAGRYEAPLMWAKFARVRLTTIPNAVYCSALVTR